MTDARAHGPHPDHDDTLAALTQVADAARVYLASLDVDPARPASLEAAASAFTRGPARERGAARPRLSNSSSTTACRSPPDRPVRGCSTS